MTRITHFCSLMSRNQSCARWVELSSSDASQVGGIVVRELNNRLIVFVFSLLPLMFPFPSRRLSFISLSPSRCLFPMLQIATSRFYDTVTYTVYPHCRPTPMLLAATRELELVRVSTSINRIADAVVQCRVLSCVVVCCRVLSCVVVCCRVLSYGLKHNSWRLTNVMLLCNVKV